MQAYGDAFARVYNLRWTSFASTAAPLLLEYAEKERTPDQERTLLDLCCGTGQLAAHFLEHGYRVTGLDLSPAMLTWARENNAAQVIAGQARFLQADAASFTLAERFELVISTFDALNHLPDLPALHSCFSSVADCMQAGGIFIFDLNTRKGLQRWNSITIEDTDEWMLINRGIFDPGSDKAHVRISGFMRLEDGRYERFEQTAYNTAFDLLDVKSILLETGFEQVYFARLKELAQPVDDPEALERVFIIGRKPRRT